MTSAARARAFVASVELPALRVTRSTGVAEQQLQLVKDKTQAVVVGSDVMSFVEGVTPERRQDLVNASLLAQLVATKRVPDATNVQAWYEAYFEVLTNLGFVIQDRQFAEYTESSSDFAAHEAIISIAATLLGGAPTALALIKTTLEALKTEGPWLTVFTRESQFAKTAKFQVTLAEPGQGDQFLVSLMAFALKAQANLTQVLIFKLRANGATLKHLSGKVTINPDVLASVREDVARKLEKYAKSYVAALPEL
jgi:hypothetical protein